VRLNDPPDDQGLDSSDLSEAALALDRELRRFEDLADQAARLKLTTERSVERATEALTRAAESQDRIQAHVQQLVAAVGSARQKQEADAAALMARAEQIAARRKEFADVLQRMAALGQMAKKCRMHSRPALTASTPCSRACRKSPTRLPTLP